MLLDAGPGAERDRAAARVVAAPQSGPAADDVARGEVRPGDDFHQLVDGDVGVVDQADQGVADLHQVVRRDRGRHADRDALRTIHQQVGKLRRQDRRLRALLVVGGQEVDRVHLRVVHHQRGDGGHAGLGITHGRGGKTGDRAEVALLVDERIAGVPVLGQADQGRIDGHVAVRVVAFHRLADDAGALRRGGPGREAQVGHGDEDPPLRRLEPVADVGQGPADDHAHRVGQVAVLELFVDGPGNEPSQVNITTWRGGFFRGNILGIGRFGRIRGRLESVDKRHPFVVSIRTRRACPRTQFPRGRGWAAGGVSGLAQKPHLLSWWKLTAFAPHDGKERNYTSFGPVLQRLATHSFGDEPVHGIDQSFAYWSQ